MWRTWRCRNQRECWTAAPCFTGGGFSEGKSAGLLCAHGEELGSVTGWAAVTCSGGHGVPSGPGRFLPDPRPHLQLLLLLLLGAGSAPRGAGSTRRPGSGSCGRSWRGRGHGWGPVGGRGLCPPALSQEMRTRMGRGFGHVGAQGKADPCAQVKWAAAPRAGPNDRCASVAGAPSASPARR